MKSSRTSVLPHNVSIFNAQIYSSHQSKLCAKSSPRMQHFFSTCVLHSLFKIIFLFVVILIIYGGNLGGNGNDTKAFERRSSSIHFQSSSSIYYETSERRNHHFYHSLNKQRHNVRLKAISSPKSTEINEEALFEPPTESKATSPPIMTNKTETQTNVLRRFLRQIVPLPRSTMKPKNVDWSATPDMERMIKLFRGFLIDYAFKREWYSAQFIVPQESGLKPCQYFTLPVLLSKASLKLNCTDDLILDDMLKTDFRQPIVIAQFIGNNERPTIVSRLLSKYSSKRKIVLLAKNETVEEIVYNARPESVGNYKWTLAKLVQNDSKEELVLEIYKVFGFVTSPDPIFQKIGTWITKDGLQIDAGRDTGILNFQGRMLRITTVSAPPVVNLHIPESASMPLVASGYLPDIWDLLSGILNFKYLILTPKDGKFGDIDNHVNWSGMVGMLHQNEADIALTSFSYTKSRLSVMDYSPPVEYSSTRLLIRRDWQVGELKLDAFFRPFEWKVWFTILVLIGLGTMTLIIFTSFRLFQATPGESMWLLSTCFLLQGQSEHSTIRVTPFRIASGTFWLLAVFIFACYTARLTSFLAADTAKLPLKNLDEAVKSRSWKIGLVKGSSFLEKVKESKTQEMRLLWKRIQDDPSALVNGFTDGIEKVYRERFIFFTSESVPTFMVKGNCSYSWLPGKYFPGFGYMGYQKGLPYATTISHTVSKLREAGFMRRTFKKWWGTTSSCDGRTARDAFTAISLHETGSAFLILAIGASIAIAFGILEFLLSVKYENWQEKTGTPFSANEFAAPVVQGGVSNLLPILLHYDRPFIWRVQSVNVHRAIDYPSMYFGRKKNYNNQLGPT